MSSSNEARSSSSSNSNNGAVDVVAAAHQGGGASASALEREARAKIKFLAAKRVFEAFLPQMSVREQQQKHCIPLLTPDLHLTWFCWGTFHRWVKANHVGWKLKRRVATAEQAQVYGATNQGKSYFVDAIYHRQLQQIRPIANTTAAFRNNSLQPQQQQQQQASSKRAAADDMSASNKKPVAKKKLKMLVKTLQAKQHLLPQGPPSSSSVSTSSSCNWDSLGMPLQLAVLQFVDVPTINAVLRTSKRLHQLAVRDECWEHSLRNMLHQLFDNAFAPVGDEAADADATSRRRRRQVMMPLSRRPLRSTEFRRWYIESTNVLGLDHRHGNSSSTDGAGSASGGSIPVHRLNNNAPSSRSSIGGSTLCLVPDFLSQPSRYLGQEERFHWLLHDVSLKTYYQQAGAFAYESHTQHQDYAAAAAGACGWNGQSGGMIVPRPADGLFDGLPDIWLFRRYL